MFNNMHFNTKQLISIMVIILISVFVLSSCDKAKEAIDETTEAVGNAADKASEVSGDAVDKAGEVADDAVGEVADDAVGKVGDAAKDVSDKAGEAVDKVADAISSNKMVGVWTGKLDSRATTLTITKQDGNSFEGKITINYRTPTKQEVKGSYNSENKRITMEDQLHSRYKGKYTGKLSDDEKTFSGTFTTLVDKKSHNFKLNKK